MESMPRKRIEGAGGNLAEKWRMDSSASLLRTPGD